MKDLKRPVMPAFQTAMYSDAGFGLLGQVLEKLTNQTYEDALQTYLAEPLSLNSPGQLYHRRKDLTHSPFLPEKGHFRGLSQVGHKITLFSHRKSIFPLAPRNYLRGRLSHATLVLFRS